MTNENADTLKLRPSSLSAESAGGPKQFAAREQWHAHMGESEDANDFRLYDADERLLLDGVMSDELGESECLRLAALIISAPRQDRACREVLADCFILRDLNGLSREHAEFITERLIKPLQDAVRKVVGSAPAQESK